MKCHLCIQVCPGRNIISPSIDSENSNSSILLGPVLQCYTSQSSKEVIRNSGTSGGIISHILISLLEKKKVDAVAVSRWTKTSPFEGEPILARNQQEVLAAAQSKYFPIATNRIIKEILKKDEKICFVGLPCQIRGIKLAQAKIPKLRQRIIYTIGIFCGHQNDLRATFSHLHHFSISKNDVTLFHYREPPWPSKVRIETNVGDFSIDFGKSYFKDVHKCGFYSPENCKYCSDATAEFADISTGDAWKIASKGKTEIVVVRNDKGTEMIRLLEDDKVLFSSTTPLKVIKSQASQIFYKKRAIISRINNEKTRKNQHLPRIRGQFLRPNIFCYLGAKFEAFLRFRYRKMALCNTRQPFLRKIGRILSILNTYPPWKTKTIKVRIN